MIDTTGKPRVTKADLVRKRLSREIRIGNFSRGSLLPPERKLAEQFNVSHMTLRKAVGALITEGVLTRNHGSGTYVCSEIPEQKVQRQLGLVLPAWSAPELLDLVMYFSEMCRKMNWLLKEIHVRSWEERSILTLWENCDALALHFVPSDEMPEFLRETLRSSAKPVVVVGASGRFLNCDCVYFRHDSKLKTACDRLHELGHNRILLVDQIIRRKGGSVSIHPGLDGFERTFRNEYPEVVFNTSLLTLEVPLFQMPHETIRRAIEIHKAEIAAYTAVICPLSFYWPVMRGLHDAGFRVPEDLSVLTFGDRAEANYYYPRPAVFAALQQDQSVKTFDLIRRRLASPDAPPTEQATEIQFTEGETLSVAKSLKPLI